MGVVIDIGNIEKKLRAAINSAMKNDVPQIIKDAESRHAASDVYGAYAPTYYARRGSLSNQGNMETTVGDMEVTVRNIAEPNHAYDWNNDGPYRFMPPPNSGFLASLVGDGGPYNFPAAIGARPFIENTVTELKGSGAIRDAIAGAIGSAGFSVG